MPPVYPSLDYHPLHMTLQFFRPRDDPLRLTVMPALANRMLGDVIQAEAWKRACIPGLALLHLYYFCEKSTPGLAHWSKDGNERYVGQSCPKEAAPAHPSLEQNCPADPEMHEQTQLRLAGLPRQPSRALQMPELE